MSPSTASEAEARALLELLRALGNPHRHRVFLATCRGPVRGKEVSAACRVTPQEASRHLARLADLGLVARTAERAHAATPQGRRIAAALAELRALQRTRLPEPAWAALPPELSLGPLLAAEAPPDPEHLARAAAEAAAQRAGQEVLRLGAVPPPWEGRAGPRRYAVVAGPGALDAGDLAAAFPPRGAAELRAAPGPLPWLVLTDAEATLFLPAAAGGYDFARPFRGQDEAWRAWCRHLWEGHAAGAVLLWERPAGAGAEPPERPAR